MSTSSRKKIEQAYEDAIYHDELIVATSSRNVQRVVELMQIGINPCTLSSDGTCPIHTAVVLEPPFGTKIVARMLEYGADSNCKTSTGLSPLHIAAMWGRIGTIDLLLDNGANVADKDNNDMSALDYVEMAEENREACIDALTRFRGKPKRKPGCFITKSRFYLDRIEPCEHPSIISDTPSSVDSLQNKTNFCNCNGLTKHRKKPKKPLKIYTYETLDRNTPYTDNYNIQNEIDSNNGIDEVDNSNLVQCRNNSVNNKQTHLNGSHLQNTTVSSKEAIYEKIKNEYLPTSVKSFKKPQFTKPRQNKPMTDGQHTMPSSSSSTINQPKSPKSLPIKLMNDHPPYPNQNSTRNESNQFFTQPNLPNDINNETQQVTNNHPGLLIKDHQFNRQLSSGPKITSALPNNHPSSPVRELYLNNMAISQAYFRSPPPLPPRQPLTNQGAAAKQLRMLPSIPKPPKSGDLDNDCNAKNSPGKSPKQKQGKKSIPTYSVVNKPKKARRTIKSIYETLSQGHNLADEKKRNSPRKSNHGSMEGLNTVPSKGHPHFSRSLTYPLTQDSMLPTSLGSTNAFSPTSSTDPNLFATAFEEIESLDQFLEQHAEHTPVKGDELAYKPKPTPRERRNSLSIALENSQLEPHLSPEGPSEGQTNQHHDSHYETLNAYKQDASKNLYDKIRKPIYVEHSSVPPPVNIGQTHIPPPSPATLLKVASLPPPPVTSPPLPVTSPPPLPTVVSQLPNVESPPPIETILSHIRSPLSVLSLEETIEEDEEVILSASPGLHDFTFNESLFQTCVGEPLDDMKMSSTMLVDPSLPQEDVYEEPRHYELPEENIIHEVENPYASIQSIQAEHVGGDSEEKMPQENMYESIGEDRLKDECEQDDFDEAVLKNIYESICSQNLSLLEEKAPPTIDYTKQKIPITESNDYVEEPTSLATDDLFLDYTKQRIPITESIDYVEEATSLATDDVFLDYTKQRIPITESIDCVEEATSLATDNVFLDQHNTEEREAGQNLIEHSLESLKIICDNEIISEQVVQDVHSHSTRPAAVSEQRADVQLPTHVVDAIQKVKEMEAEDNSSGYNGDTSDPSDRSGNSDNSFDETFWSLPATSPPLRILTPKEENSVTFRRKQRTSKTPQTPKDSYQQTPKGILVRNWKDQYFTPLKYTEKIEQQTQCDEVDASLSKENISCQDVGSQVNFSPADDREDDDSMEEFKDARESLEKVMVASLARQESSSHTINEEEEEEVQGEVKQQVSSSDCEDAMMLEENLSNILCNMHHVSLGSSFNEEMLRDETIDYSSHTYDSFPNVSHLIGVYEAKDGALSSTGDDLVATAEEACHYQDISVDYDWKDISDVSATEEIELMTVPEHILTLTNPELRSKLMSHGENPGPITPASRRVYERHLTRLEKGQASPKKESVRLRDYTPELRTILLGLSPYCENDDLEVEMAYMFKHPEKHTWREGTQKSSFNYLLLDPRVLKNLAERHSHLSFVEQLRIFTAAIFYVGKGKKARPYEHLHEASKKLKEDKKTAASAKMIVIWNIWGAGMGVVSVHIFHSIIPVEAYTREGCIVDAMGLSRLTNLKRGEFYGPASQWCVKKRRLLGIHLVVKAMRIYLIEGERQIRECDLVK